MDYSPGTSSLCPPSILLHSPSILPPPSSSVPLLTLKGHLPHLILHKNRSYLHDFSTFSSFSPSLPLVDKKVSDFAVLYSIENQDVSVGLPIQCLKASHSLLPRASYSTFNEPILYPSYFCPPTDMENVHIRLSLFLESSSWLK